MKTAVGIRRYVAPVAAAILTSTFSHATGQQTDAAPSGSWSSPVNEEGSTSASLARAVERARHAVHAIGTSGGFVARNPGQEWTVHFDGRGVTLRPDGAEWRWGLELRRYGPSGCERPVGTAARIEAGTARIEYVRDGGLTEWFVNDRRGVEHGYTVHAPPPGAADAPDYDAPLVFELATRGGLAADVMPDGLGARFHDADGTPRIIYGGLFVTDADGKPLPARMEAAADGLRLVIDVRGARYPVVVDPLAHEASLKAPDPDADDAFGASIAVSGETVVVGAPHESSHSAGVDGDAFDNSLAESGAAFVFVRSGTTWVQQAFLKASNPGKNNWFGTSVAFSGDTIVVGAPFEESGSGGVDGNQSDNSAPTSGAAYVFVRNGTIWSQQAYLKAAVPKHYGHFGTSVAASGDTVVVGSPYDSSLAAGVDGSSDEVGNGVGSATVFVRNGTTWTQQAYLKASNPDAYDQFGSALGASGDVIVVGAPFEASKSMLVDVGQGGNSAYAAGAAYVFARSGGTWTQQAYLKASNTEWYDKFGCAVAVSGETVVVGARHEDGGAHGVNGPQGDWKKNSGAAYVFVRDGGSWSQQAYLKASNTRPQDQFGSSVAAWGDTILVGSPRESGAASGPYGAQDGADMFSSGACYLFARVGSTWYQRAYLKASNTGAGDFFGGSVAVAGDFAAVGAAGEDGGLAGVDAAGADDAAPDAGAAYVFDLHAPGWIDLGGALAGSSGKPILVGAGALQPGAPAALVLSQAPPNALAVLFLSTTSAPAPLKGGMLVPVPSVYELVTTTDASGTIGLAFPWPDGMPSGIEMYMQWGILDPGVTPGVALSNALAVEAP